jgi:hypothetical protein
MDVIVVDKWTELKKRWPPRVILKSYGYRHSMSRTCGPRDMISLVIPRIGDNSDNQSAIHVAEYLVVHSNMNHVDLHVHFLRQLV